MADCRRCAFFIYKYKLSGERLAEAEKAAARRRQVALGWCAKRGGVVTYYVGKCRHFVEKPQPATRPLKEYFKGE